MITKLEEQLFDQMERLATAPDDAIAGEVSRSEAMCQLSGQVIDSAKVRVSVIKLAAEYGSIDREDVPKLLGHGTGPASTGPKVLTGAKRTA